MIENGSVARELVEHGFLPAECADHVFDEPGERCECGRKVALNIGPDVISALMAKPGLLVDRLAQVGASYRQAVITATTTDAGGSE